MTSLKSMQAITYKYCIGRLLLTKKKDFTDAEPLTAPALGNYTLVECHQMNQKPASDCEDNNDTSCPHEKSDGSSFYEKSDGSSV
ncbi:hypothetical protein L5515_014304 [Caenorhabditis briggsae]|uniref:Uncharacterized protein n=1 Tax=Caenorhabditis briggsae TaxID=6238 RepID=A0AAE9EBF2_CAEBR|nr:hypothetical protein L5515_014304 [Caenorhabditis briggsae]